ncbi:hypothetical protein O181_030905 [Austropuccinia psidii MF-1]|uniref:Uncharacterized protein n=1 Tax=Austropuccinia psidii MF-1 TaxID=1389203 RepID=A0A9Q3CX06_9BASI|nr:hypothetical protein [Austropuccinia psidii MF-1]
MAFWGHLGTLQSIGPLGPFWLNSNEAKRGQGGDLPAPKARWTHLSQVWPPISTIPKMAKRTPGPKFASGNHQRQPAQFQKDFPSIQGKTTPSPLYSVPKDLGVVHI